MTERKRKIRRRFGLGAAALALLAALLADSAWRLVVTEYTVSSPRLPAGLDGLRIVQLSDLHGRRFGNDNERLVERVRTLRPDLIALTGDYIEGADDLPVVEALCRQLVEIAPTYFTSGNHDWGSGEIRDLAAVLDRCGVRYLRNEFELFTRNGESLVLAGVEDPNSLADMMRPDELVDIINNTYTDIYRILFAHRNDFPEKYPDLKVDIIFSGHGHGGVVRLPGGVGLLGTDHRLFPDYDAGLFSSGRYQMIVSRGLGGNGVLPVPRLFNNPEIVCVTLKTQQ